MATELIYLTDSQQATFEATVVDVRDGVKVVLDRTAFYPGGGGQPCDVGNLAAEDGDTTWIVESAKKNGDEVEHTVQPSGRAPRIGERVGGEIDWERRYALMRMHTALHVLCGVVFNEFDAQVTGGNMGVDKARMDFELDDLSSERVAFIERRANEEIQKELDVVVNILPRDEAFQIPDLIRTKINLLPKGIEEVRTVEIVGLDLQADGGTHVRNTSEIGGIEVIGTRSKGRNNKRLEIALRDPSGERALQHDG